MYAAQSHWDAFFFFVFRPIIPFIPYINHLLQQYYTHDTAQFTHAQWCLHASAHTGLSGNFYGHIAPKEKSIRARGAAEEKVTAASAHP